MTFKEAAHHFKIPIDDLKSFEKEGLLSEPFDPQEINNLSFLSYFCSQVLSNLSDRTSAVVYSAERVFITVGEVTLTVQNLINKICSVYMI